uniref:Small ribosomal subunit protein uS7c n=1 Tax=Euglenaformis proxima TaxID=299110 RepID=A0A023HHW0_9EUGL|nr:ribosomal protein S7 [Euglenaformis proxima]AGL11990.1 ribosomal protein S7 [Euglenaformis proxima]
MSRKSIVKKRLKVEDSIYNSVLVSVIINRIMVAGKKSLAQRIFYDAMKKITESSQQDSLEVLKKAIQNVTPLVEIKSRRVGGATYQVPIEVKYDRGISLSVRFLIRAARNRPGKIMSLKLKNELLDASNNLGNAVKRKEEIHKMAEANKAFTNLRF